MSKNFIGKIYLVDALSDGDSWYYNRLTLVKIYESKILDGFSDEEVEKEFIEKLESIHLEFLLENSIFEWIGYTGTINQYELRDRRSYEPLVYLEFGDE